MNGLMTEQEWRRAQRRRRGSRAWGAQCVLTRGAALRADRAFRIFLVLTSLTVAALLPTLAPHPVPQTFPEARAVPAAAPAVRSVSAIAYAPPSGLTYEPRTYTHEQLARGTLLLLDEAHPLPSLAPAPNAHSVAVYGKGRVPVNGFHVKAGARTVDALAELFSLLRQQGVSGLTVWRGTLTADELAAERLDNLRELCVRLPLDEAVQQVWLNLPVESERRQEYAVELRLSASSADLPDARPLEDTPQGRALLHTAWRCGFIRCGERGWRAFTFRYVGKAHAMAMKYLNLTLPDYLDWLRQRRALTLSVGGKPRWLILCEPVTAPLVSFSVPTGAACEVSLDNAGYAVAVCTLPQKR